MITVYYKKDGELEISHQSKGLSQLKKENIIWIDLKLPSDEDREMVEKFIEMHLLTKDQAQEIESSSKYSESHGTIISNSNFFLGDGGTFSVEPVSFIITQEGMLVSLRQSDYHSFLTVEKRVTENPSQIGNGYSLFCSVLEARIDFAADMIENVSKMITVLSKDITSGNQINKEMIYRISELQENIMSLRENIYDLQRVLSGIARSTIFPENMIPQIQLMLKDVNSLINHSDFGFQRLDYMQDTAMGLINIEQNEIVKILSVAAVVFMPPTLIASIYGMNFKYMPELDWAMKLANGWIVPAGYLFALALMLVFTLLTIWFFRYKKWL